MFNIRKYKPKKETSALAKLRQLQHKSQSANLMTRTGYNVYLLLDMSTSMEGDKFIQAKSGALDFACDAISRGWQVGLIAFHDSADLMCELTNDKAKLTVGIARLATSGSTNMVSGLKRAVTHLRGHHGKRYIVMVTDGCANEPEATLQVAEGAKREGIEIITLGTPDAHLEFLRQLASSEELTSIVADSALQIGMTKIAGLLPYHEH